MNPIFRPYSGLCCNQREPCDSGAIVWPLVRSREQRRRVQFIHRNEPVLDFTNDSREHDEERNRAVSMRRSGARRAQRSPSPALNLNAFLRNSEPLLRPTTQTFMISSRTSATASARISRAIPRPNGMRVSTTNSHRVFGVCQPVAGSSRKLPKNVEFPLGIRRFATASGIF